MSNKKVICKEPKKYTISVDLQTNVYNLYIIIDNDKKHWNFSPKNYGPYALEAAKYSAKNKIKLNNWFEIKGDYTIIYTYNNGIEYKILVDTDDYNNSLKDYYWGILANHAEIYAVKNLGPGSRYMHTFIMNPNYIGVDEKELVHHVKGSIDRTTNTIDNRRSNLRIKDIKTNNQNRININKNNTTGINGVQRQKTGTAKDGSPLYSWVATWRDENSKPKNKKFSINKLGEEEAKKRAITYREQMVKKYYDIED